MGEAVEILEAVEMDKGPQQRSPLDINLVSRSRALLEDLNITSSTPKLSLIPSVIYSFAYSDHHLQSPVDLLDALSSLASVRGLSDHVLDRFEPIALDLLARWLENVGDLAVEDWEARLQVVAKIGEIRPELWNFVNIFLKASPFRSSPFATLSPDSSVQRLHSVLLSYLRLITSDPSIASRYGWPSLPLHKLRTQHTDTGARLLAIQILAKQRGWSEVKRMEMEKQWVGDVQTVDAEVIYDWAMQKELEGGFRIERVMGDGWMIGVMETQREIRHLSKRKDQEVEEPSGLLSISHLSPRTALVADTLALRASVLPPIPQNLIHVPTVAITRATASLLAHLQRGTPTLITSPPSSGKTHILQYLSSQLYPSQQPTHRILTIPLADTSIDVKSLIGTYVSSPTKPGTFEWMEGALAKAVRAGRWVVFEDIDRASMEMLVTIAGIARSLKLGRAGRRAKLAIPGRDDIEAGDGFALFATRTVRQAAITPPTFFGHYNLKEVTLEPPTDADILAILSAQFDQLPSNVTMTLVEIWRDLRPLAKAGGQTKGRDIGLRDLEKWCARVQRNLPPAASLLALEQSGADTFANPVFQDEAFLEAVDTFIASLDSKAASAEKKLQMALVVAERIGMDAERAISLMDIRKPQLEISTGSKHLRIGRTSIPIAPSERRRDASTSRPFALTKPSLVLLERIAASATLGEPTLLVGETGTGKTTAVQYLATISRKPLTVLNLSTQTESSDLLGGFKPIDASVTARLLHAKWQKMFCEAFSMAKKQNSAYLEAGAKALNGRKWARCADLWSTSARRALDKFAKKDDEETPAPEGEARKRRKVNGTKATKAAVQWQAFLVDVADFNLHHVKMNSKLVFSFIEGPLVKALQSGEWILLDEVNLASQETLEAISTILEGPTASLVLTERGDVEPIRRHPDFRLFACMNPATDVGKKDLPPNLRARFTELYVPPPDDDREALVTIVAQYLGDAAAGDKGVILDVVEMYSTLKQLSAAKEIVDGSNAAPHYSMRTLARALMFAVEVSPLFGLRRGLWEGCLMAFTMSLDATSIRKAHEVCELHLLTPMRNARAALTKIPTLPSTADPDDYIRFGPFWLRRGPLALVADSRYIITPSVQSKLSDLARVILTKRYPVLIQGPTSAGKTSAVEFLARQTGHRFVRINNHEHTDIQEYLGTYVTDPQTGNLVFQEGLLVTAVRQGHWIVLDELNLAPTDVLEALNRLLDDNRELVIPETQEVIKPHPNFILFATQNPPGLYAGRKVLSRAFRNRFLEVHFDDVPKDELETILCQRCEIAPSYAKRIVQVFEELRHRRQATRVFESKSSFATLRDLFRWAERGAVGYQQLADDGYMLLAERARQDEDKIVIKQVLQDVMKVTVDEDQMYRLFEGAESSLARLPFKTVPNSSMVWTRAMQRLFVLVAAAAAHNEPVLLVGETGCGKTSVCETIAEAFNQRLIGINCHQNMETADLLGSQRPVRNRLERRAKVVSTLSAFTEASASSTDDELLSICAELLSRPDVDFQVIQACEMEIKQLSALFEWSNGPLVHAMQDGDLLLLDEVSLADDSVLERLNSVLEPGRTLVLAEKGGVDIDEATLVAASNFHVVATMNPGGDFGKKELSPALRNRFTEIWVPPLNNRQDLLQIIGQSWKFTELAVCGEPILDFFAWFGQRIGDLQGMGLRDILAWVNFSNHIFGKGSMGVAEAYHHGGQMVIVDGLESLHQVSGLSISSVATLRLDCLQHLSIFAAALQSGELLPLATVPTVSISEDDISVGGFSIARGSRVVTNSAFRFEAPTTALNAMRVLRASQLPKAILLEGSPGVGKTSLVSALAALAGHQLQRINLSDQTDLIDLFGSDLPVEGGKAGEFQWRDAAFLDAMQKGDWVLLDEMNLASQTVLEGLNAVLDHRGTVFIPELGRSFDRHPDFRVFAAQNPLQQGGGRKGLPKSFLNRFTKVYLQEHTPEDLLIICQGLHPMPSDLLQKMISFNEVIREQTMISRSIGREGSPWEFNLRDLSRWFRILSSANGLESTSHPVEQLRLVYLQRFRTQKDRLAVSAIFESIFECSTGFSRPAPFITPSWMQIGNSLIKRSNGSSIDNIVARGHLDVAESVLKCIEMGWLVILAGENASGKRTLVRAMAEGAGRSLGEFAMHPGVDTSEILGSFEQQDTGRLLHQAYSTLLRLSEVVADFDPASSSHFDDVTTAFQNCISSSSALPEFIAIGRQLVEKCQPHFDVAQATVSLDNLSKAGGESSGFAWVDGQLLDAIRSGGWFLITDANLCSASVLDRLNSLCETDGTLVMSEKGSSSGVPEVITPNADFRLFMTYDPRHGELSRAMRNRGVELYIGDSENVVDGMVSIGSSGALSDQSIARAATVLAAQDEQSGSAHASSIANTVTSLTMDGLPYVPRFGRTVGTSSELYDLAFTILSSDEARAALHSVVMETSASQGLPEGFASAFVSHGVWSRADVQPNDVSINPNIKSGSPDSVFRLLQLVLRNQVQQTDIQAWMLETSNVKSVLVTSMAAMRRGPSRAKQSVGNAVYPFTSLVRDLIGERASVLFGAGELLSTAERIELVEQILLFVSLIEKHAQTGTFDYSATQLLAQWLKVDLGQLPYLSTSLAKLEGLAQSVKLTSGFGQAELWAMFRNADERKDNAVYQRLLQALAPLTDAGLRYSVMEAFAVARTENADDDGYAEIDALMESFPIATSVAVSGEVPSTRWSHWTVSNAVELELLSNTQDPSGSTMKLLLQDRELPIDELFDLECAVHSSGSPAVMMKALSQWLERIWEHADVTGASLGGPASLFQPIQLTSALRFSMKDIVRMSEIPQEQEALTIAISSSLWTARHHPERRSAILHLAKVAISTIFSAFDVQLKSQEDLSTFTTNIQNLSNDSASVQLAVQQLVPSLRILTQNSEDLNALGSVWLDLSRLLLDLYVTNVPIDPAVRRVLLGEVAAMRLTLLREELAVIENAEMVQKGVCDSARVSRLRSRIALTEEEQDSLGPAVDRASDAARLGLLFGEVHAFLKDAFHHQKIIELADALKSNGEHCLPREISFQLASSSFVQRLSKNYADLLDLVQPIITSILFARFGMRCLARATEMETAPSITSLSATLRFPTVSGLDLLQKARTDLSSDQMNAIRIHSLAATAYAYETSTLEQRSLHVPAMVSHIDHLYQSWSSIRLREQRDEQASESLYRVKKTDVEVLSDEELEEREFAELFPQFNEDHDDEEQPSGPVLVDNTPKFGPIQVSAFHNLVTIVFGPNNPPVAPLYRAEIDSLLHSTFRPEAYDDKLDRISLAFQIAHLYHRQAGAKTAPTQQNFYVSANEPEILKVHALIMRLVARLNDLVAEWPEQMVLQHILERCHKVLALDNRSPVAQALAALEKLLQHTEDWESYANRDNSLKAFQQDASALIIEWRRLELASWMRLLDDQFEQYIAADREWTIRLYGTLIHASISAEDIDKHLATILPMISTYLNSSTFGHFESRLAVISAFQRMAFELSLSKTFGSERLGKVSMMLSNIISNARLYGTKIRESLLLQRAVVDKAIKDFVKLASWKDVNVYALRASAQKSHRQLHKNIRKFRDALRQSVGPVLSDSNSICPQDSPELSDAPNEKIFARHQLSHSAVATRVASAVPAPDHLLQLEGTFDRYCKVLSYARQGSATTGTSDLEEMAVEIIETAAMLAKATPLNLTKENTKIVNNLASRKRKAFADLMKALRASGFSQNVRADQLARQQSVLWLTQRPSLVIEGIPEHLDRAVINKVDSYHHRSAVLMSTLRAAFNGHSPDIASQDLQRGIRMAESVQATALVERDILSSELRSLALFGGAVDRLRECVQAKALSGGPSVLDAIILAEKNCGRIRDALREVEEGIRQFRELEGSQATVDELKSLHDVRQDATILNKALTVGLASIRSSGWQLYTDGDLELLQSASRLFARLCQEFSLKAVTVPELAHLYGPVAEMVRAYQFTPELINGIELSSDLWLRSDEIIQTLLVAAQQMDQPIRSESVVDDERLHIPGYLATQKRLIGSLRVPDIAEKLESFAQTVSSHLASGCSSDVLPNCFARILPFIETLRDSYAEAIAKHLETTKATYKLGYVVGRIMLDLAQKGFCKPSEESAAGKNDKEGDSADGTGMGAGTGDKNVSSEIEEEGQVEGLQGEKEEEEAGDKKDDEEDNDDAVDMENDFEGALEDGKEGEDEDGSDGEDEEHDDHVGDVDPLDPGAVDEKFWGDEDEKEEKHGGEDLMNEKTQEKEGESEMTAKENETKDSKKPKDDKEGEEAPESAEINDTQHDETPHDDDTTEDDGVEGQEDEAEPSGQNQDEVAAPEGDKLDLPEDLDLGSNDGDEDNDEDGLEDDIAMSGDDEREEENGNEPETDGLGEDDSGDAEENAPEATGATEEDSNEPESINQNLDLSSSNDAQAQEASDFGKGEKGGTDKKCEPIGKDEQTVENEESADQEVEAEAEEEGGEQSAPQGGNTSEQQNGDGPTDSSGAPLPANGEGQPQSTRSLGDILKEIRRRRDEILSQTEREVPTDKPDAPTEAPGQVEYLQDDQEEDMQALGPAGEEEQQKLADLKILDEDMELDDDGERGMDDTEPREERQPPAREAENTIKMDQSRDGEHEKALTQADIGGHSSGPAQDETMELDEVDVGDDLQKATETRPDVDIDEIEIRMGDEIHPVSGGDTGEELWRHYSSLTSDLSYALCEQLRLILEPTLATRLQGDFRTGKRLNMRKIIPYIASEYTKDKIWLRRTKPSRREYQVLLSLDDSRSMAESHSVHLAYQTLAMVSQALNKLEVGQVSIARFGEAVDILHSFGDAGFTDADGAKVMNSFRFDQHRTDVAALVERTLSTLAEARQKQAASSSAPDLWQLQIIISDGVCQDHHKLRTLLRKALEERVMIVFLIVDSLHQSGPATTATTTTTPSTAPASQRPSILSMQTVAYKQVNGEMQLEMERYLDTFPFEFYVVLRDVEALPGVLSDTLRQWMARVSQSEE